MKRTLGTLTLLILGGVLVALLRRRPRGQPRMGGMAARLREQQV